MLQQPKIRLWFFVKSFQVRILEIYEKTSAEFIATNIVVLSENSNEVDHNHVQVKKKCHIFVAQEILCSKCILYNTLPWYALLYLEVKLDHAFKLSKFHVL